MMRNPSRMTVLRISAALLAMVERRVAGLLRSRADRPARAYNANDYDEQPQSHANHQSQGITR